MCVIVLAALGSAVILMLREQATAPTALPRDDVIRTEAFGDDALAVLPSVANGSVGALSPDDAPDDAVPAGTEAQEGGAAGSVAELLERYEFLMAAFSAGDPADHEAMERIHAILRALIVNDPLVTIENLKAAMEITPGDSWLGSMARNYAGGHLMGVLGDDAHLHEFARDELLHGTDASTQYMMLNALLNRNLRPGTSRILERFEYNLFEAARRSEDGGLRLMAFGNLHRSGNEELVGEMFDYLFDEDLDTARGVTRSMHRAERMPMPGSNIAPGRGKSMTANDRERDFVARILEAGESENVTQESMQTLMSALMDLDRMPYLHALRARMPESNVDPAFLEWFDRYLERIPEPIEFASRGDRGD